VRKLLLISAAVGAIFGAKKLRQRIQTDGSPQVTARRARRRARHLAEQARPKVRRATAAAAAKATEILSKDVDSADYRQTTAKPVGTSHSQTMATKPTN
jgi:hypothetical protein